MCQFVRQHDIEHRPHANRSEVPQSRKRVAHSPNRRFEVGEWEDPAPAGERAASLQTGRRSESVARPGEEETRSHHQKAAVREFQAHDSQRTRRLLEVNERPLNVYTLIF